MKTNMKVRTALLVKQMAQWKFAEILGTSESAISRAFRKEWTQEAQEAAVELIMGERTDREEVWKIIKRGGARDTQRRKDGNLYPSQERAYVEKTIREVEEAEARRELERAGYL